MRKIFTLLLSLILFPYMTMAQNDTGDFEITGESSSYSYSDGVLTVNDGANITISMAGEVMTPTSDRIAVNGNAEITLNGVNITAPSYSAATGYAQSAIDVSKNGHLVLNLADNTSNVLTGGNGGNDNGTPGIHVPESASLVIQGSGGLSVTGGNSSSLYGGNGIGGKPVSGQAGEACGTVIILSTGTVTISGGTSDMSGSNGTDISGGSGSQKGDNGQGIRPVSGQENTYTVWGDLELPCDITIPHEATVIIPEGASLDTNNHTLTNNGTIRVEGTLEGEVSGTVQKELTAEMVTVAKNSYTYTGEAHEPTVTIEGYAINTDYTVEYSNNMNAGTATITVKPTDDGSLFGEDVTKTFTITPAPAVLEYAETEVRKQVGDEAFTNELTNESSIQVSYESSNTNVATVDASSGEVTILAAGTATITATDNDPNYEAEEASYTLVVDLITLEEGSGISITGGQQEVEFDGTNTTMTLTATVTVSDGLGTGRKWIWASSNPEVAVVPEYGDDAEGAMSQANDVTERNSTATVTIKGAGEAKITATYTDSKYKGSVEFVLTVTEPEEPETPVIPDMPEYYNIMVEECEGVTVETSTNVVREGQSMTFTIDIAEGYTDEDMTVKVKRSLFGTTDIIEPNDEGIYEVKNIYTDIYITVDGVEEEEEETPTGMKDVEGAKVYTKDGSIYVQTPKQEQVQIISISGAVLKSETQVGLQRYGLPRGIYIICIGEERFKVRN